MKEEKDIQPIDKLFRQSLEGYNPVPPASVWKKISSRLGNGGSSFARFFTENIGLFVVSAVLVSIIGIWAYSVHFSKSSDLVTNNQHAPAVQSISSDKTTTTTKSFESKNDEPEVLTGLNDSENPVCVVSDAKTCAKETNSDKSYNATSGQQNPGQKNVKSDKYKIAAHNKVLESGNNVIETSTAKIKASTSSVTSVNIQEKDVNSDNLETQRITIDSKLEIAPDSLSKSETALALMTDPGNSATKNLKEEKVISPSAENDKPVPATSGINPTASESNTSGQGDSPNISGKTAFNYYLGANGSFGKVMLKNENDNSFYSVNALFGITHKKSNFSLETGIGYSHYNDQGNYRFEFQRSDTTGYTGYTFFNSFDSSYLIIYKPTVIDTLLYHDTITNTLYSYLRIPLYFSKQLFRSGKFSMGVKTGPSVEFLISSKNPQPDYQFRGANLISVTNNSYARLSTSWEWLIAPQLNWDITDKIIFRVEPAAIFYLNNLYDKNNRPATKPYGISVTGGLIWQFR
jgi:hypothetical protein